MEKIERISISEQNELLDKALQERTDLALLTDTSNENYKKNRVVAHSLAEDSFEYFANNFVWIQNPRADNPEDKEIPFLLWDYQAKAAKEIIKAVENGYDLPIEKSRDMGMSWLIVVILVWGWNFKKWECLVGSQKAENVDTRGNIKSLIEKARYIIDRAPSWIIPNLKQGDTDKQMLLVHPKHRATIAGESNNTNFGRSDRRKVILFDEFTSWEQTDKAAWQSCSATTKCRIPLSTPNTRGTNCYYYQIVQDSYKKGKPVLRLHWSLNPIFSEGLYVDEIGTKRSPWYDEQVKRSTNMQEVYQELDIDYEASMGDKVFPEFKYEDNVSDTVEYDPNLPLYIAWDFGLDETAMLWIQPDKKNNTFNIIDEYTNNGKTKEGSNIFHYLDILDSKPYKNAIHFGDPHSGENRSITSGQSPATILRRHGIIFKSQRTRIVSRVGAGRTILKRVRVASNCTLAIEMFTSWQMKKTLSGTGSQIPDHSEYSHIGEAFTYFAWNYSQRGTVKHVKTKKYSKSTSGIML